MARPRYPSDEARAKQRPHVKVHHSWPTHPHYGRAYANRDTRAVVLGIWMVAGRAHASATGDRVTMSMSQIMEATACGNPAAALRLLCGACAAMGWTHTETRGRGGVMIVIDVRNYAKKQGFTPRLRGGATRTPDPSDSEEPKNRRTDLQEEEAPAAPAPRPRKAPSSFTVSSAEPRAPEVAEGAATRTDPAVWARMFASEPDPPPHGVAAWVASVLPVVEGEADAAFRSTPSAREWRGKVRALLWRYWRHRAGDGPQPPHNGLRARRSTVQEETRLELLRRRQRDGIRLPGDPPLPDRTQREMRVVPALVASVAADGRRDD